MFLAYCYTYSHIFYGILLLFVLDCEFYIVDYFTVVISMGDQVTCFFLGGLFLFLKDDKLLFLVTWLKFKLVVESELMILCAKLVEPRTQEGLLDNSSTFFDIWALLFLFIAAEVLGLGFVVFSNGFFRITSKLCRFYFYLLLFVLLLFTLLGGFWTTNWFVFVGFEWVSIFNDLRVWVLDFIYILPLCKLVLRLAILWLLL